MTLVVLAAIPLALGLIGYIVPLQIGARGVACPRLDQLSYWLYLVGGVTIYASFLYTAPESGTIGAAAALRHRLLALQRRRRLDRRHRAGDARLRLLRDQPGRHRCAGMRAPGLAWRRLPLFSWAATVIGYMLLVIGPVMIAALAMLEIDRHFDGVFFDPGEGGAPLLYEHLAYIFFTGAYLIVFLAAAGAISEILPTFARKPLFSHRAVAGSFVAIGVARPARLDAEHVRRRR